MPTIQNNFRVRKNFGKLKKIIEVPNLIDIQKRSYDKFLQSDINPRERREDSGTKSDGARSARSSCRYAAV